MSGQCRLMRSECGGHTGDFYTGEGGNYYDMGMKEWDPLSREERKVWHATELANEVCACVYAHKCAKAFIYIHIYTYLYILCITYYILYILCTIYYVLYIVKIFIIILKYMLYII